MKTQQKVAEPSVEYFLEFVNKDIPSLAESDFMALIHTYTRFLCQYEAKYPFIRFREKHELYAGDILERRSPEAWLERKPFFVDLQAHLASKLQAIIKAGASDYSETLEALIEIRGTRKVSLDTVTDSFVQALYPEGVQRGPKLDLDREKLLADLVFSDMVIELQLKPSRFRKCLRPRCGKFFYQPTGVKKKYCDKACSNAERQYRHSKKQEKTQTKRKARKPTKRKRK